MHSSILKFSIASVCFASLISCGGGGGSAGEINSDDTEGATPITQNPTRVIQNSGLSGSLFYYSSDRGVELNLSTGTNNTIYSGFSAPSPDGEELTVVRNGPLLSGIDELGIISRDGTESTFMEIAENLSGTAKLSYNNSLIAIKWLPESNGSPGGLAIFDRQGKLKRLFEDLESDLFNPKNTISSWEWLPDGGLLFSVSNSIYKADRALETEPYLLASFGELPVGHLSIRPDGTQVAFPLGSLADFEMHIHVMNIDGTGLRQLTQSSISEDGPSWSPDGHYIAFRYPARVVGAVPDTIPIPGSCPRLYIVPSTTDNVNLYRWTHIKVPTSYLTAGYIRSCNIFFSSTERLARVGQALVVSHSSPDF